MESFNVTKQDSSLHVEGFPDAVKVIGIDGPLTKRLADLALHKVDLEFADQCLEAINLVPDNPLVIREALWRSAIVHFMKCFGDSGARFQISPAKVLKDAPPEALMAFDYFKQLRNKHLVHDENSYAQSLPGAVLNDGTRTHKIEKVLCLAALALTLGSENYGNLKLLIGRARSWVDSEFDRVCTILTRDLEALPYQELWSKRSMTLKVPTIDELHKSRDAPRVR